MWIRYIPVDEATGRLRRTYDRIAGDSGTVDNILLAHSLKPHTLEGHMALYKSVLHHNSNRLPVWFLECIGVLVSRLNGCRYCEQHHFEGLRRLVGLERAEALDAALASDAHDAAFTSAQSAALAYAARLTSDPDQVGQGLIDRMRQAGLDDGEILEVNQVTAYFAYANRVANGLGITVEGDELGLSPPSSDDLTDWEHR